VIEVESDHVVLLRAVTLLDTRPVVIKSCVDEDLAGEHRAIGNARLLEPVRLSVEGPDSFLQGSERHLTVGAWR
jgi:hypothetical protein